MDQNRIHIHPVLDGYKAINKQLKKAEQNYEIRSRHERYRTHLDYEFYVTHHDKYRHACPKDCSFFISPKDNEEVHHRKFGK
jgi:hypothetical protein